MPWTGRLDAALNMVVSFGCLMRCFRVSHRVAREESMHVADLLASHDAVENTLRKRFVPHQRQRSRRICARALPWSRTACTELHSEDECRRYPEVSPIASAAMSSVMLHTP